MPILESATLFSWPAFLAAETLFVPAVILAGHAYAKFFPDTNRRLHAFSTPEKCRYWYCILVTHVVLAINLPFCYSAVAHAPAVDGSADNSPLTTAQQVCIGGRAFVWLAELNYLFWNVGLLLHHVFSLTALVLILLIEHRLRQEGLRQLVLRQLAVVYLAIHNEVLNKGQRFLRMHGLEKDHPRLARGFQIVHIAGIWVIRIPAIFWALYDTCFNSRDRVFLPLAASWCYFAAYAVYQASTSGARLGLYGFVQEKSTTYFHIGKWRWTSLELAFKTSLALLLVSTSVLYSFRSEEMQQTQSPVFVWLGSLLVAYTGLRSAAFASRYLSTNTSRGLCQPQYWFEGGLTITSVLAYLLIQFGPDDVDRASLLAAVAMSILVLEAGVHLSFSCDGPDFDDTKGLPGKNVTHLATSFAATTIYVTLSVFLSSGLISLAEAGAVAMATRGFMRLFLYIFEFRKSACLTALHTSMACAILKALYDQRHQVELGHPGGLLERPYVYAVPMVFGALAVLLARTMAQSAVCQRLILLLKRPMYIAILGAVIITWSAISASFSGGFRPLPQACRELGEYVLSNPAPLTGLFVAMVAPTKFMASPLMS